MDYTGDRGPKDYRHIGGKHPRTRTRWAHFQNKISWHINTRCSQERVKIRLSMRPCASAPARMADHYVSIKLDHVYDGDGGDGGLYMVRVMLWVTFCTSIHFCTDTQSTWWAYKRARTLGMIAGVLACCCCCCCCHWRFWLAGMRKDFLLNWILSRVKWQKRNAKCCSRRERVYISTICVCVCGRRSVAIVGKCGNERGHEDINGLTWTAYHSVAIALAVIRQGTRVRVKRERERVRPS